jgi:O-antigen/teichoic acid export membrane protein
MIGKIWDNLLFIFTKNNERQSRLILLFINGISSFGSKAVTMLVSIISLPLTIHYLGNERFGMMETMVSLITIMNFADFGLGFGLQNRVAELNVSQDETKLQRAISSVFCILLLTSTLIILLFCGVYKYISWSALFNLKSSLAIEEVKNAVLVFFTCFVIQIPFSVVQKVQVGFQEGYKTELWKSFGNIFGLLFLLISIKLSLGVPYIILSIYGSNTLFLIISFFYEFLMRRKYLFPYPLRFDKIIFSTLYKDGGVFFFLQLAYIMLISSDRVIIAHYLGASIVSIYSVGFRLAMVFSTPIDAFASPLLPAFNDALSKNDTLWIKQVLIKGLKYISSISIALALCLVVFGNIILQFWVGKDIHLSLSFLLTLGAYIVFSNFNSLISYIMLTPQFIRLILPVYLFSAILGIILKVLFVEKLGLISVIWATILPLTMIFFTFSVNKLYNKYA